jgi:hypothetical protein
MLLPRNRIGNEILTGISAAERRLPYIVICHLSALVKTLIGGKGVNQRSKKGSIAPVLERVIDDVRDMMMYPTGLPPAVCVEAIVKGWLIMMGYSEVSEWERSCIVRQDIGSLYPRE